MGVRTDIRSLSQQINDFGAGTLPPHETPARPQSFTPPSNQPPDHARQRERLYARLKPLIDANAAISALIMPAR